MKTLVLQSNPEVPLTLKFFLAAKKVLFVLITLVKKLESHDFSSIFHEFLKFEKYAPLWFTAELQGEWAESVCDVSRGSQSEQTADQRSQRDCLEEKILQCLIQNVGLLLRIAVM